MLALQRRGSKFWRKMMLWIAIYKRAGLNSVLRHKAYVFAYISASYIKKKHYILHVYLRAILVLCDP